MCYETIPHNTLNRKVITRDQFGIRSQTAVRTEEICLPTKKTHLIPCEHPDENGTAVIFDEDTKLQNTIGQFIVIQPTTIGSPGLMADGTLQSGPSTVVSRTGTPATGETYTFDTEMLQLTLQGGGIKNVPVNFETHVGPRTPGDPVQSFDTDMHQLD